MAERLVDRHIEKIRKLHPEVFGPAGGVEEGEVLPEVITQSSKRPLIVRPPLGATPMELSKHRADTHIRIAHGVSNAIAHATGVLDGVVDSLANGTAEIVEDLAFLTSKTIYGVKHGWSRGKFQTHQGK